MRQEHFDAGGSDVAPTTLEIGGLTPLTTIDFPGRLAAVIFFQGCPWRCGYCQNGHLIAPRAEHPYPWDQVLGFLERRQGLLDGVVFSGGEPTVHKGLDEALAQVRALGFETGLHTAGPYPDRLAAVLPRLDWVGMDIKAPAAVYPALTHGGPHSGERAWESLRRVLDSGIAYEVRTTVHSDLLDAGTLWALARELADLGVARYVLQPCVSQRSLDPSLRHAGPGPVVTAELHAELVDLFPEFRVREL